MASAVNWNIPVIGYLSSDDALSDKTVYSTLARTTPLSATFFAQAVKAIVTKNGWKRVAYAGANTYANNLNRQAVKNALAIVGVTVHDLSTNGTPSWQSIANSKAMTDLHANARGKHRAFPTSLSCSIRRQNVSFMDPNIYCMIH